MLGVRSRGSVTLCSADPLAQPAIDPAYLADDAAVREWIRANVATAFHAACSCAMGGDGDAVLDPELIRVR